MSITFTSLQPIFAAECSGIDIGEPLLADDAAKIHQAMDRYAVLVFRRGTPLTTQQHIAFSTSLGNLEAPFTKIMSGEGARLEDPRLSDVSNLSPHNRLLEREDRKRLHALGNRLWHSDSSYKHIPAKYSALVAHVIPPEGGDTEFADMRAAWDTLDANRAAEIKDLVVEHSRIFSKGALGFQYSEQEVCDFAPVRQPLVRVNPRTGG